MKRIPVEVYKRAAELLDYNPETGLIRWKVRRSSRCKKGWFAGSINSSGYPRVGVNGRRLRVHRLAFYIAHGYLPDVDVDHRDEDKSNNKIENLRAATSSQNSYNISLRSDNTSGVRGVYWDKRKGKWYAHICVEGDRRFLGYFRDLAEATKVRREAELRYFGEFAPNQAEGCPE